MVDPTRKGTEQNTEHRGLASGSFSPPRFLLVKASRPPIHDASKKQDEARLLRTEYQTKNTRDGNKKGPGLCILVDPSAIAPWREFK